MTAIDWLRGHEFVSVTRLKSAILELDEKLEKALKSEVVLVVEDDGDGFDVQAYTQKGSLGGIGLISMRERVYAFEGIFTIESEIGKGTEIIIEFPCRIKGDDKDN